jgi:AcrR family transcriptional regulator
MQTSLQLFTKQGYDATGLAQICDAAGVSKGAFYHHFISKHDLFIQLLDTWLEKMDRELSVDIHHAESVPKGLSRATEPLSRVFTEAEGRLPMVMEFWLQSYRDPILWKKTIAPFFRYQVFFEKLLDRGIREGSIDSMDTKVGGQIIVALSLGLLLSSMFDPGGADWSKISQNALGYLMVGMKKEQ